MIINFAAKPNPKPQSDSLDSGDGCLFECDEGYGLEPPQSVKATNPEAWCGSHLGGGASASASNRDPYCETTCMTGTLTAATCRGNNCNFEIQWPETDSRFEDSLGPGYLIGDCPRDMMGDTVYILPHGTSCQLECQDGYTKSGRTSCNAGVITASQKHLKSRRKPAFTNTIIPKKLQF